MLDNDSSSLRQGDNLFFTPFFNQHHSFASTRVPRKSPSMQTNQVDVLKNSAVCTPPSTHTLFKYFIHDFGTPSHVYFYNLLQFQHLWLMHCLMAPHQLIGQTRVFWHIRSKHPLSQTLPTWCIPDVLGCIFQQSQPVWSIVRDGENYGSTWRL